MGFSPPKVVNLKMIRELDSHQKPSVNGRSRGKNDGQLLGNTDLGSTPWKINMEHNNGGLEDDVPFQFGDFYVPC